MFRASQDDLQCQPGIKQTGVKQTGNKSNSQEEESLSAGLYKDILQELGGTWEIYDRVLV